MSGVSTCSSCGLALSAAAPDKRDKPFTPDDVIFIEPRAARTYSDPFITIWEGSYIEGSMLVGRIQAAGIPVETGEAAEAGLMRVQVPRSYVNEAYEALDNGEHTPGLVVFDVPDDASSLFDDPDELPPERTLSPGLKALIGFVAIALVLTLLFTG